MSKSRTHLPSGSEAEDETTGLLGASDQSEASDSGAESTEELYAQSDSDDAPEEVGFTSSRQSAIQKVKDTLSQIRTDKQSSKERRKKREELYTQQKRERLANLADNRLPEDLLEQLQDEPIIKKPRPDEVKAGAEVTECTEDRGQDGGSEGEEEKDRSEGEEDYIPLQTPDCGISAVALPEFLKQNRTSQQTAEDFRQRMLYGNTTRREGVESLLGRKAKRKARLK